jgi:hypothetical protein
MQVLLQGSLRHFSPQELLAFLLARAASGTLDLETTGKRTRVVFDKEKILWAESNQDEGPVDAILDTFEWTAGTFTLVDSTALPDGVKPLALELGPLLDEAKRRVEEAEIYPDDTTFRVVEDPATQQQLSLNIDQLKLLFRLTAGRTFAKLVGDLGMPKRELSERLRELSILGLVTVVEDEPATPAKPKTAPPVRITLVGSLTPDNAPDNVYPLLDAEHTIGRAPSNSITITDGSVSTNHACIRKTPEGFVIEDLKSRNGTFVNGEKVAEKRLLVDGDLIRLGKVILTFNVARDVKTGDVTTPEVRMV